MIKKSILVLFVICISLLLLSYNKSEKEQYQDISYLRKVYSQPDASKWPKPHLDSLIDKIKKPSKEGFFVAIITALLPMFAPNLSNSLG